MNINKEFYNQCVSDKITFESLGNNKPHEDQQLSALIFLFGKLKNKMTLNFLNPDHDLIWIGNGFDDFLDFSNEDIRTLVACGVQADFNNNAFYIYV